MPSEKTQHEKEVRIQKTGNSRTIVVPKEVLEGSKRWGGLEPETAKWRWESWGPDDQFISAPTVSIRAKRQKEDEEVVKEAAREAFSVLMSSAGVLPGMSPEEIARCLDPEESEGEPDWDQVIDKAERAYCMTVSIRPGFGYKHEDNPYSSPDADTPIKNLDTVFRLYYEDPDTPRRAILRTPRSEAFMAEFNRLMRIAKGQPGDEEE